MKTVQTLLNARAAHAPDAPFLINSVNGHALTWGQLHKRARAVTGFCQRRGLVSGDCVAFAMGNGVDAAALILGLMYGGFTAVAVNLVAGSNVIRHVLNHSEAKLIFAETTTQDLVADLSPAPVVMADSLLSEPDDCAESSVDASDQALLMYTSGTTGVPKGVLLSQQAVLSGGRNAMQAHELTGKDRALCVLPLYHINGLCITLMGPFVSHGSVVIPQKFSVNDFWDCLRRDACTWFSVVPTQISYLLHASGDFQPIEGVRFGRSASAPLAPDVHQAFEARFSIPIIETMGLTETAAQILSNPLPPRTRKLGSPGIAFGNEVMIADETQNEVPCGIEGEVLVRGDNLMTGYLKNPDATAAAITVDGWLRSGDLGRMDEEGYIYITGRLKELIIKGGENVAPREIDDVLYSDPEVIEAAAFSVPCSNYGESIEAAIVVKDGCSKGEAEFLSLCVQQLGAFKCPDRIHFFDELPKGPSGKIQRLKLHDVVNGRALVLDSEN